MKIGFDISAQSLPRSGVGHYQINLLNALLKIDHENFYNLYAFNFRNRQRFKEIKFPSDNYKVKVVPIPQRLITLWWFMADFPPLEKVAGKCDIYQVSEICIQPVKKAKRVAFVHDLTTILFPEHHVKSNVFLHKMRFKNIHKVDAILTNSEYTRRDIINHLHIKPDKVFVTYLGADERFKPATDSEIGAVISKYSLKQPYILFVGTLEPRKNVKMLIQAFNVLKQQKKIPHKLVLAGQKGWDYEEIFQAIEGSRFKSEIQYIGYIPDDELPALLTGSEVFVYPSLYEGFGLPVLEAMQCGAPVITSNVSSMPEIGGNACVYFNPNAPDELIDKIFTVLNSNELRKTLSEKGINRAKFFSWEKCAEETLKVYETIAGR